MNNPLRWVANLFRRGDDPRRQVRYVLPYPVSGLNLTPDETLSIATVWACMDAIASGIASCPWNIYQPLGPHKKQLLFDDPIADALNVQPNPEMTAIAFREAMLMQAIPFGNSYAEIVHNNAGRVAQLWPLMSDRMQMLRDENWQLVYRYRQADGSLLDLPPSKIFHLKGPGLGGLMGENIVARAAKSISVAAAQERYAASFFGQGASPQGVLTYPGKLSDPTYARLKGDWAEKKKGPENAHKPLILEEGMKFEATSFDPEKSQLTEGRQFSVEEIARWFKVPPHKIGHLLRATFSNIEHQSIEFVRDCLRPWCRRLEQEAAIKLFNRQRAPWKQTLIDTRELSQGDSAARAAYYASGRQNGWLNANEIRGEEGLDEIGSEGDVYLVNGTLKPIDQVLNPPPPPTPMLPAGSDIPDAGSDNAGPSSSSADAKSVARTALSVIMGGAYDRFARRLENRRTSLSGKPKAEIAAAMAEERAKSWPRLETEIEVAQPFAEIALGRRVTSAELAAIDELVWMGTAPRDAVTRGLPG